jgi:hypothetical protein
MACREALLDALTQTHRALMAYSRCLDVLEDEEERERFEQVCVDLATQAKTLQDHLLGYALYWGRGRGDLRSFESPGEAGERT